MYYDGGFGVRDEWNKGGWSRLDALAIIVCRFYIIMFIISIVISIIAIFTVNKAVEKAEHFRR